MNLFIQFLFTQNLRVEWLLEAQAHVDHISATPTLREQAGGKRVIVRSVCQVRRIGASGW